jgi:hypothetical protein
MTTMAPFGVAAILILSFHIGRLLRRDGDVRPSESEVAEKIASEHKNLCAGRVGFFEPYHM